MEENYFLAKWLNDELTPEELAEFKAKPDYDIYEKIKQHSQNLTVKGFDEDILLQKILEAPKKESKPAFSFNRTFYKIAAVFVIFASITYFTLSQISKKTYITDSNNTETLFLPDHSKVILKQNSEINLNTFNWHLNRKLQLKGIAYFHVSKGNKFVVKTDLGKVSVLGTKFEVKSQNKNFNVICYEGKVKVNFENKEIILTKGMQVNFDNGKQTNSVTDQANPYETDSLMIFKEEKLENILAKIEGNYHQKIENKTHSEELFTGKIPTDNLNLALSIIASTYNLKYQKTEDNIILFEKK